MHIDLAAEGPMDDRPTHDPHRERVGERHAAYPTTTARDAPASLSTDTYGLYMPLNPLSLPATNVQPAPSAQLSRTCSQ